jgi:hypothetical protein
MLVDNLNYKVLMDTLKDFIVITKVGEILWQSFSGQYKNINKLGSLFNRKKGLLNKTVPQCLIALKNLKDISCPAIIKGDLAPYIQLQNTPEVSFINMANELDNAVKGKQISSSETSELHILDMVQWKKYGPSIQSSLDYGVQVLQLTDKEEINSIPVVISEKYWAELTNSFAIEKHPFSSVLSGALISTRTQSFQQLVGIQKSGQIQQNGHLYALIPDSHLIEMASLDIDIDPRISLDKKATFYLAYLWVVYKDNYSGNYWPIYEYGNIADPKSYSILSDMLINRIAFYKKRVWKDVVGKRYSISIAMNDDILQKIVDRFSEKPKVNRKELLAYIRDNAIDG